MIALPPVAEVSIWHKFGLLACTLFPLYYLSYEFHPHYGRNSVTTAVSSLASNGTHFQEQWLRTHLLEPFNPAPIKKYCNETKWRPNLVFNLPNANGGIGNVRAEMLDFVFYAIEAGASIILPGMARRSEEVLFDVWGAGRADFNTMFDEQHFKRSLSEACPQLKIYDPDDKEIRVVEESDLSPKKVGEVYWPEHPLARRDTTKDAWLQETNLWLSERNVTLTSRQKWIVDVERTMWQVDTRNTPQGFRFNLPMTLRINPSIRQYAGIAMSNLARRYQIDFTLDPIDSLHQKAFYGAHLRTESDTVDAGWQTPCSETECGLNFTSQTDAYIGHAIKNNLNVVFVASGDATEIQRFKRKAAAQLPPLTVLDKFDILPANSAIALQSLHWDQQALVDLEILLRCSVFGGMAKSSFAFTIAMARNTFLEEHGYVMENAWEVKHRDTGVAFEDRLSKVWGRNQLNEERVPKGAWP